MEKEQKLRLNYQGKVSEKLSIVIVDDNEIDLMIGERLLSRVDSSIGIRTFSCAEDVLSWLENSKEEALSETTLFLIDIYMPVFNGFYVADNVIDKFENLNKLAVCYLLSATIDISDNRKIKINPKVEGYIGKPITVTLFKELIEKHG